MRFCTKCSLEKSESEFFVRNKTTGQLHTQCKQCYQAHRKTYYFEHYTKYKASYLSRAKTRREKLRSEFRTNMLQYLSGKFCVDCGESDIRVLELDHLEPKTKEFSVSQAVRLGYNWDQVLNEIKKCQILCANCHKKKTAQDYNWYKAI